jgi:Plasmid pRiA4b ORF-3-like protein
MTYQFKIQLKNISDPLVWRRLLVPAQFSFMRFHKVIQAAFGWEDNHLFQFSPKGYSSHPLIGIPEEEFANEMLDSKKIILYEIFTEPKQKFMYVYDLGDDWKHNIMLEKQVEEKMIRATCLDGGGACPPEDCGGAYGYENLKLVLDDPKDPDHGEMKKWLGLKKNQKWDADAFDLAKAGSLVGRV